MRHIMIEKKDAQSLLNQGCGVCDEIGSWSLLKLISLKYLGYVYASITKKRVEMGELKKMCYVDLFSGSGINKVKNKDAFCFGSPLVINRLDEKMQFTRMFLNDDNENTRKALESRLAQNANAEYEVTSEDANSCICKIASEIDYKCHSLIFIDPFSTELSWKSMEIVLNLNADIFFLYQTGQIPRGIPVAKKPDANIMNFFKDYEMALEVFENKLEQNKPRALFELYKNDVLNTRGPDTLMENIRIRGPGVFYYDMLFITRKTRGGNPWFRAVTTLKKKIEFESGESVMRVLDVILGKQTQLSRWYGGS